MSILNDLFSGSKDPKPVERPVVDYSLPRNAADVLLAWSRQITANGPVDQTERERAINCSALRSYKPSHQIPADDFKAYSPERQLICDALDEVMEQGELTRKTLANLKILGDKGILQDTVKANVAVGTMDYVR